MSTAIIPALPKPTKKRKNAKNAQPGISQHVGTRLGFSHAKHVAAITVEEGGHRVIRDATDVNRDFV